MIFLTFAHECELIVAVMIAVMRVLICACELIVIVIVGIIKLLRYAKYLFRLGHV